MGAAPGTGRGAGRHVGGFAFLFLDCEFGGLDPERHDITEIGVVLTDYRLAELASSEWKVRARPERITPEAAEIFGYDPEVWEREGVPLRKALEEMVALLPPDRTVVPAGQNVRMDVAFLERGFRSCGMAWPFDYHVIDLATLFYAWSLVYGEELGALSLRHAATRAGLADGSIPHRALGDARLTLETFRYYIGCLAPRAREGGSPLPSPPPDPADGEGSA